MLLTLATHICSEGFSKFHELSRDAKLAWEREPNEYSGIQLNGNILVAFKCEFTTRSGKMSCRENIVRCKHYSPNEDRFCHVKRAEGSATTGPPPANFLLLVRTQELLQDE
jgi:hypothetical protein